MRIARILAIALSAVAGTSIVDGVATAAAESPSGPPLGASATLRLIVTATNAAGSTSATSAVTGLISGLL